MPNELENKLREEARRLLESGEVKMVIGYAEGSAPFKTTPIFIEKPEDVDKLVWNPASTNNLAVYLPKVFRELKSRNIKGADDTDAKVAVVVKPCDAKSIVTLLQENQIKRENVHIIGLTCQGIAEAAGLTEAGLRLAEVTALGWFGGKVNVVTKSGETSLDAAVLEKTACKYCQSRTPVISDTLIGDEFTPEGVEEYQDGLPESPEERREYWAKQFERCIRCYACRQVCPSCYCHTCFADRGDMKWITKRDKGEEAWMFHATRAIHLAGRCISCGECTRVCPVGIPVMKLTKELERHVKDLWDFEAGTDPEAEPVLGTFKTEDADPLGH